MDLTLDQFVELDEVYIRQAAIQLVPLRIGHNYRPVEVLDMGKLYTTYRNHKRLRVFFNKGLKCEYCEKRGLYLIRAIDRGNACHVDLYTDKFELMTIDHVLPKSKGGTNELSNLVPCCDRCNCRKGSKIVF
jgi:hypothetical protein